MITNPNVPTGDDMGASFVGPAQTKPAPVPSPAMPGLGHLGATPSMLGAAMELIGDVTTAESRRSATEQMTFCLAKYFSGANVRCAVGTYKTMQHFFDNRIGWVGKESSLYTDAMEEWSKLPLALPKCSIVQGQLLVIAPDPAGGQSLVIWVQSPAVSDQPREWLATCLQTLAAAYWKHKWRPLPDFSKWLRGGYSIALALAISILGVISIWPAKYPVDCTAVVQPVQQRLVAAPFEATLLSSEFKPGDRVKEGQVLVRFDGRPLRLELASIEAEMQQYAKQQDVALATGKIAEAQQAELKHRQLSRQGDLIRHRLTKLEVVSPADGIVVSGDLDQYVGSPLTTGQVIAEVAPLDRMVIEVEIPDYEIEYLASGADAKIKINGIGGPSIRAKLNEIYPSAEVRDEQNVFVGRVELDNPDGRLRPGMRGDATAYGPRRPLIWSWVRGIYEKVLWRLGY